MKRISSILLITTAILLSPVIASAQDPETVQLYKSALEQMDRPLERDDFRRAGLHTARDYNGLTQMYLEAGDYEKALGSANKALELDPFDPIANLNAGLINYQLEDYEQAAYYLDWALRIEKKAQRARGVHLGEDLLSTSEPPAYQAITGMLEKATEQVREDALKKREETEAPPAIPWETARTEGRTGLLEKAKVLVSPTRVSGKKGEPGRPRAQMPPDQKADIAAFYRVLGNIGMMVYVSEVTAAEGNANKAVITVNNRWAGLTYLKKMSMVDKAWAQWQGVKRKTNGLHGMYRIQLVDSAGETVGGSNWLNTKVWVKEP